jgi:hypothetical protein
MKIYQKEFKELVQVFLYLKQAQMSQKSPPPSKTGRLQKAEASKHKKAIGPQAKIG